MAEGTVEQAETALLAGEFGKAWRLASKCLTTEVEVKESKVEQEANNVAEEIPLKTSLRLPTTPTDLRLRLSNESTDSIRQRAMAVALQSWYERHYDNPLTSVSELHSLWKQADPPLSRGLASVLLPLLVVVLRCGGDLVAEVLYHWRDDGTMAPLFWTKVVPFVDDIDSFRAQYAQAEWVPKRRWNPRRTVGRLRVAQVLAWMEEAQDWPMDSLMVATCRSELHALGEELSLQQAPRVSIFQPYWHLSYETFRALRQRVVVMVLRVMTLGPNVFPSLLQRLQNYESDPIKSRVQLQKDWVGLLRHSLHSTREVLKDAVMRILAENRLLLTDADEWKRLWKRMLRWTDKEVSLPVLVVLFSTWMWRRKVNALTGGPTSGRFRRPNTLSPSPTSP